MSNDSNQIRYWDDPLQDYRQRYQVPEHFLWDPYDLKSIDYAGYLQVVFELLSKPPCLVLDVGCGDGWVAQEAIKRSYSVTGIDYSDRAIGFAKLMVPKADFFAGDVRALSDRADWQDRFNAALLIEVLEHIPPEYHEDVLVGIGSCVKPQGMLVMTLPSTNIAINPWHYKHFAVEEGIDLLRKGGFEVSSVVNQHIITLLSSSLLWRLLHNKHYDLRFVRRVLRKIFMQKLNTTNDPNRAARYVYQAVKAKCVA